MSEEKKKKPVKPVTEVKLRTYPKIIFFYPLLFTSLICWIIEAVNSIGSEEPLKGLGYFWIIVFFCNIFVMAFDFSSAKFFILILGIVIGILLFIFYILPVVDIPAFKDWKLDFKISAEFYMAIFILLTIVLFFVWVNAQFDYYKVERNEIYHKQGIFANAERFPIKSLRIKKDIPDIFEFLGLRAGSITLMPGKVDEVIQLNTVLNINKKAEQIDFLLSHISVEPDEID